MSLQRHSNSQPEPTINHDRDISLIDTQLLKSASTPANENSKKIAAINESLTKGQIPQELAEKFRLVPIDSEAGAKFQSAMEDLVRSHIPTNFHDIDQAPIRFVISDTAHANAAIITTANPPIIIINKGFFAECKIPEYTTKLMAADELKELDIPVGDKDRFISSIDELMFIIGHELCHLKVYERYGSQKNSKFEEGYGYLKPLELLADAGLNPFAGLYVMDKQSQQIDSLRIGYWTKLLDPHPLQEDTLKIITTGLAQLLASRGTLPHAKRLGLDVNSDIIDSINMSKHRSYLDSQTSANTSFETLSVSDKISVLTEAISNNKERYPIRYEDINSAIRSIESEFKAATDLSAINKLCNVVLDQIALDPEDKTSIQLLGKIYRSASGLSSARDTHAPRGRLKDMAQSCEEFVSATIEHANSPKIIAKAAQKLLAQVEAEPLYQTKSGREFLHTLSWPQFDLPVITDRQERKIAKIDAYLSQFADGQDLLKLKNTLSMRDRLLALEVSGLPIVPWQPIREHAANYPEIMSAAVVMGLADDYIFGDSSVSSRSATEFLKKTIIDPGSNPSLVPDIVHCSIQNGPSRDPLLLSEDGGIMAFGEFAKAINEASTKYFCFNIAKMRLAQQLVQDDEHSEINSYAAKVVIAFTPSIIESNSEFANELLVGMDDLTASFEDVFNINRPVLAESLEACKYFLDKIAAQLKTENPTFQSNLRRVLFDLDANGSTHRSFIALPMPMLNYKLDIQSIYANFILSQSHGLFTNSEKIKILDRIIDENPSEYSTSDWLATTQATKILGALRSTIVEAGLSSYTKTPSWSDIANSATLNNIASKSRIVADLLNADMLKLLETTRPRTEQIMRALKSQTPEMIARSPDLCKKLGVYFRERSAQLCNSGEVSSQLQNWQIMHSAELLPQDKQYSLLADVVERILLEATPAEQIDNCESLLLGKRIANISLHNKVVATYAKALLATHGVDDGSESYNNDVTTRLENLRCKLPQLDRSTVFNEIAKTLEFQSGLVEYGKRYLEGPDNRLIDKLAVAGMIGQAGIEIVRNSPESRRAAIEFLVSPLSFDSTNKLLKVIGPDWDKLLVVYRQGEQEIDPEEFVTEEPSPEFAARIFNLRNMSAQFYENFWTCPLEVRTVIARELLIESNMSAVNYKDIFNKVTDSIVSPETENREAVLSGFNAYIAATHFTKRDLLLSAMMVGAQRTNNESLRFGQALALVLERIDPALTKVGQIAPNYPSASEELREDLQRLKYAASPPNRSELIAWIDEIKPEIEKQYNAALLRNSQLQPNGDTPVSIQHIGKILGSASLYVNVKVDMTDGQSIALAIRRPYAQSRMEQGFEVLSNAWAKLGEDHPAREITEQSIALAKKRAPVETNCKLAQMQYERAAEIYNGSTVRVRDKVYSFSAASVIGSGDIPLANGDSRGFFMMDLVPGSHFVELPNKSSAENEQKQNIAIACLTKELSNILKGTFESDRHGAQLKISGNKIGHFDFTGMAIEDWSKASWQEVGKLLARTLSDQSDKPMTEKFFAAQKNCYQNGAVPDELVLEINKALFTLGDFMQPLNPQQIKACFLAALSDGVHPDLKASLVQETPVMARPIVSSILVGGTMPDWILNTIGVDTELYKNIELKNTSRC